VGAGVAEEVVAGKDVVDLEAVAARETFAYVTLQEGVMANEVLSLTVAEHAIVGRAAAGLTVERNSHSSFPVTSQELNRAYHRVAPRRTWTTAAPDL
jgi:hypothetical protein